MRVLVTTTGNPGHLLPLVPVARALSRAGHEVVVATQRSRSAAVRGAGLTPRPFDDPPASVTGPLMAAITDLGVHEANARVVGDLFARVDTRAALPGVLEIVESWRPDLVVRETYEFAGALAAERHDLPQVRVGLGLASTEAWAVDLALPGLDELRAGLGLPGDPTGERIHRTPYVTFVPDALEDPLAPGPAGAIRCRLPRGAGEAGTPGRPAGPASGWASSDGRPLVYASLGTMASGTALFPGLYRDLVDLLSGLPVRALITTGPGGDPAAVGALPPNVRVTEWVRPEQVLPHAAAAISHGGFGTTLGALGYGVPLVVLPLFAGDQWQLARRVADTGAGIALPRHPEPGRRSLDRPAADVLAELPGAVLRVLDDARHRDAASRLADRMAALPEIDEVVGDLLAPVGGHAAASPTG